MQTKLRGSEEERTVCILLAVSAALIHTLGFHAHQTF